MRAGAVLQLYGRGLSSCLADEDLNDPGAARVFVAGHFLMTTEWYLCRTYSIPSVLEHSTSACEGPAESRNWERKIQSTILRPT